VRRERVLSHLLYIDRTLVRIHGNDNSFGQIPDIHSEGVRDAQHWRAGQDFVFIPKGKGVLVMPVPTLDELKGLARGADPRNVRDRKDRY
jgi:hypothetical protein